MEQKEYRKRIRALEKQGLTTSDAQGVLEAQLLMVEKFKQEWKDLCKANFQRDGDRGSCVLGAYVEIAGHQVTQWDVAQAQGASNWEVGLEALMQKYRNQYKVEVHYSCGWMD